MKKIVYQSLLVFLFVCHGAVASMVNSQSSYDLEHWNWLSSQVQFQQDILKIGNRYIGESEINLSTAQERTVFVWNAAKNEVVRKFYARPNEFQSLMIGEPSNSYEWKWRIGITVKQIFLIQDEINRLVKKIQETSAYPKQGADYMREMAQLLDRLMQIEVPNVLVKKSDQRQVEPLNDLKIKLIETIGEFVTTTRRTKTEFVFRSFWENLETKDIGKYFLKNRSGWRERTRIERDIIATATVFQSLKKMSRESIKTSSHYVNYLTNITQCESHYMR